MGENEKKRRKGKMIAIRSCKKNMTSHKGFLWPKKGRVTAPDWDPTQTCGGGLHVLLPGDNNPGVWYVDGKFLAVDVNKKKAIDIEGKHKVQHARVVFVADNMGDLSIWLKKNGHNGPWYYSTLTGGNYSTLTGGYRSTLTGGNGSTLTGGYRSTLTGGDYSALTGGNYSTLTGGYRSTLTGGDGSTLTGGYDSTLTGGDNSTLTGGNRSTLTGGNYSTLTGGDESTLTGGYRSTLTGGYKSALTGGNGSTLTGGDYSALTGGDGSTLTGGNNSTLTGGNYSVLYSKYWNGDRFIAVCATVGMNGIKENTPYKVNNQREWIEKKKENEK